MSVGLSIIKFMPIGGGQDFCKWLAETFNGRAVNDDYSEERVWIESKKAFNKKLELKLAKDKSTTFLRENQGEIDEIRNYLSLGGVELSIFW